jgi:tripartite-type tricarboxylate transporter receptor subunit TctC
MTAARLFTFLLAGLATAASGAALADTYPSKPVKIVVSTSAGGITDLGGRLVGQQIAAKTGQTVVIDNRSGAIPAISSSTRSSTAIWASTL